MLYKEILLYYMIGSQRYPRFLCLYLHEVILDVQLDIERKVFHFTLNAMPMSTRPYVTTLWHTHTHTHVLWIIGSTIAIRGSMCVTLRTQATCVPIMAHLGTGCHRPAHTEVILVGLFTSSRGCPRIDFEFDVNFKDDFDKPVIDLFL